MELQGAEIRNILKMCSDMQNKEETPLKINVPHYQRPYRWEREHISNLISDYYKNKEDNQNKEEEKKSTYFVGSVVLVNKTQKTGYHDIIDGQQRTTTVFLLNYLRFVLLRAYIEEIISIKRTSIETPLKELERAYRLLLGSEKCDALEKLRKSIVEKIDTINEVDEAEKEKRYEEILTEYQETVGLPKKDFTDKNEYYREYQKKTKRFLKDDNLGLRYARESYNEKLKQALSEICVTVSKDKRIELYVPENETDSIVEQYLNALQVEYEEISNYCNDKDMKPLDHAKKIIDEMSHMIENIEFCVIMTGNERDAYTLFEVLNDRALTVDDLELIKNLFFKQYCTKSQESESDIDDNIEKLDELWGDEIFTHDMGNGKTKLISYLGTIYLTADENVYTNKEERYREIIEKSYLEKEYVSQGKPYSYINVLNDIKSYQMLKVLIDEFDIPFRNSRVVALAAECNTRKSITYKTLHLLNALGLNGVIPAITNMILKEYVCKYTSPAEPEIHIDAFRKYVKDLGDDWQHKKDEFSQIHKWSFIIWKTTLLAKDHNLPRSLAKDILSKVYNRSNRIGEVTIQAEFEKKLQDEFIQWTSEWQYGKQVTDFKMKVLFINLFAYDKVGNKLNINSAVHAFTTSKLELDHMEAKNPDINALEKYFEPKDPNDNREKYINSLGNFMILDRDDNNDKNNKPLVDAIIYYDNMAKNHWLLCEVKELLENPNYYKTVNINGEEHKVPVESFFSERRSRLQKYFLAILKKDLNDTEIEIH